MVTRSLSDCSNSTGSEINEDGQDNVSVATSTDSEEEENSHKNELVLAEDLNRDKPSFGNIAVTNSTDVHFGNKTYYQGPVTIKQFLYATPQISISDGSESSGENRLAIKNDDFVVDSVPDNLGKDNPIFIPDISGIKIKNDIDKIVVNGSAHQAEEATKGTRWLQNFSRQHLILIVSLAAVLLISLVTLMIVLLTRHQPSNNSNNNNNLTYHPSVETDEGQSSSPSQYPIDPNVTFTLPTKLKIVSRQEWVAQPPVEAATPLALPVPYVIIMHTATENCSDIGTCTFHVRFIQSFHVDSRGWWDIGYNFLVGGDGYAYEGRGWKSQGAHTYGYNAKSIGIAFIGTFNQILPPLVQINAAKQLIEIGVEKGYIAKNYKVLAARQLQTTQSPGLLLYEDMKQWPHWSEQP